MGQMGFFDLSKRYTGLDAKNEPLAKIDEVVPWEDFRGCLDAVWRRSDKARKSRAGRKPWDAVVMFKTIILSALYRAPLRIRDLTEDDWLNGLWPSAAMLAPGFPGVFRAPIELFPLQDRAQAISYPEYCHTAAARRFSWSRRRML